ncbi:hypothetical protein BH09ACT10_BH09ACT10_01790 [soil metagenome]
MAKKAPKASKPRKGDQGKKAWTTLDRGSNIAIGLVAARLAAVTWKATTGRKAPQSPRDQDVSMGEALTFAAITGVVVQLTRVFIGRKIVDYWVRSTGDLPPDLARETAPKNKKEATKASSLSASK